MFNNIPPSQPDAILALMTQFRADPRDNKLDLGVGVYKDTAGATPIMAAVKAAETRIHADQDTKTYVGPTGDRQFCDGMCKLVFGDNYNQERIRAVQTPGGSGALKVIADMLHMIDPDATTWVPDPTWPNHVPMLTQAGHKLASYTYYDIEACEVDFTGMLKSLEAAKPNDIVVLHGCCHNPTGADLTREQWHQVADLCSNKQLMPFIDMAYQGFGQGLEEDAYGVRYLAEHLPEVAIATSCSKNFALYRERVGAALLVGENSDGADLVFGKVSSVVRANYSMPPDHGSAVVNRIFNDADLNKQWHDELDSMCDRMQRLRRDFAAALRKRSNSDKFDYIEHQRGMFSRLPLNPEQIEKLRDQDAIYIVGDGRVNIAGLPDDDLDGLASKIVAVL